MSNLKQVEKSAMDILTSLSIEQIESICYKMISDGAYDARSLAPLLGITEVQAMTLMSSKNFLQVFYNVRSNLKKYQFLGKSLDVLSDIVESPVESSDTKIKAINTQAQIFGYNKQQIDSNITITVESILENISRDNKENIIDVKPLPGLE